jgi:broad specificity phosphatase PhoE
MKFYLIRHGQTTGDLENRFGGDYDDHLTDEGITQANQLADKLKGTSIEIIFSSPKIRAQQVSQILNSKLGCEQKTLDNLRERNQNGVLTGLTREEAKEKFPTLVEEVKDYKNQIEGAESYQDFKDRVSQIWNEISKSNYSIIGIVTHGGVIRTFFREILKAGEIDVADCGYAIINSDSGKLSIEKMDGIETRTD